LQPDVENGSRPMALRYQGISSVPRTLRDPFRRTTFLASAFRQTGELDALCIVLHAAQFVRPARASACLCGQENLVLPGALIPGCVPVSVRLHPPLRLGPA